MPLVTVPRLRVLPQRETELRVVGTGAGLAGGRRGAQSDARMLSGRTPSNSPAAVRCGQGAPGQARHALWDPFATSVPRGFSVFGV
jgi:hypothetical protein